MYQDIKVKAANADCPVFNPHDPQKLIGNDWVTIKNCASIARRISAGDLVVCIDVNNTSSITTINTNQEQNNDE